MHARNATPPTARPRPTGRAPHGATRDLHPQRRRALGATARHIAVELTPQAIEQIANRVAHRLLGAQHSEPRLLSAGELAQYLGVERPWVYKHRHLLGGQRIGDGPKAPWRFDRQHALQALARHHAAQQQHEEL